MILLLIDDLYKSTVDPKWLAFYTPERTAQAEFYAKQDLESAEREDDFMYIGIYQDESRVFAALPPDGAMSRVKAGLIMVLGAIAILNV